MAYENDILTRNDNDELAVRTVQSVGDNPASSYDDVYTRDNNGKLAVRVVGSGGGDSHNKGYFATQAALEEAYPTGEAGDYAIVGSTDTVWVWDTDTSAWVDTDTKGQVTSVNGQTGDVTVQATLVSGTNIKTINGTSLLGSGDITTEAIQTDTMPTAEVGELGKVYQFIGTTGTYTHGYFYECVSDGQNPATYSWSQTNVQPAPDPLPSQTGNNGKFLTTDGTDASWSDKPLVNNATGTNSVAILGTAPNNYAVCIGNSAQTGTGGGSNIAIGYNSKANGNRTVCIGASAKDASGSTYDSVVIGGYAETSAGYTLAVGNTQKTTAQYAIQIGTWVATNSDANTFKVANHNGNYEMMSADGTIPADRLIHAINKYSSMPTAASTNEGWIVQFTGTTDSTYTHGHLYECVSDGGNPATYSWTEVSMGGGSSLPSQTGNSGKFLTTDGTDASWSDKPLVNTAIGANSLTLLGTPAQYSGMINIGYNTPQSSGVIIGNNITGSPNSNVLEIGNSISGDVGTGSVVVGKDLYCNKASAVVIGNSCKGQGIGAIAIGTQCNATAHGAIQIGWTQQNAGLTNADTNTFKVGNANGNFEMMSADGTIPTARLTKVNTTATLTSAGWSGGSQTVTVTGVTATGIVFVSPDPTDQVAYTSAGIICTAQAANSLTFTATSTPASDLTVNVVML